MRTLILLPLLLAMNTASFAQSGFSFGSSDDDAIDAIAKDADGNIYVGGFEGGDTGVENWWPVGNSSGFVEKRSPAGSMLWRHEFDTPDMDSVEALAIDGMGRVLVAGRTLGSFTASPNVGQTDAFMAILDAASGSRIALLQFGDERPQHPVSIVPLPSGNVVVAGYDDVFVEGHAVTDLENAWLARFDFDGAAIALVKLTKSSLPYSDMITAASAAGDGTDDVFYAYFGTTWGVRLLRVDSTGTAVWDRSVSPSVGDYVERIVISPSNGLYVAGTTLHSLAGPALGNSDSFVLEVNPADGVAMWSRQLGSAGAEWTTDIAVDSAGNLLVAGVSDGAVQAGHVTSEGAEDPFVIAVSPDGSVARVWQGYGQPFYWNPHLIAPSACKAAPWLTGVLAAPNLPTLPAFGKLDAMANPVPLASPDSIFESSFERACIP